MEEKLLQEAIETLKKQKRPELIDCPVYGQYEPTIKTFMYSDSDKSYVLNNEPLQKTAVKSARAFSEIIKEELKRRNNETGAFSTVVINLNGGYFSPDDNSQRQIFYYNRLNSQQWNLIKGAINKTYNHKNFLLLLQALKPSLEDFNIWFQKFSTLRIVGNTKLESTPFFTSEGAQSGYICRYRLEDGTTGEENFPSGFTLDVPFAKADCHTYQIPIDLLFARDEFDNIQIEVQCPLFENIEEQAVINEAQFIKTSCENFKELLVLSDF